MIETLLFTIFLSYVVPEDRTGRMPYPSGIKDMDDAPQYVYKESENPVLTLPVTIYDNNDNLIPIGEYQVQLSKDAKKMFLIQIGKIVATFPVQQSISLPEKASFQEAHVETWGPDKLLLIIKKEDMQFYSVAHTEH